MRGEGGGIYKHPLASGSSSMKSTAISPPGLEAGFVPVEPPPIPEKLPPGTPASFETQGANHVGTSTESASRMEPPPPILRNPVGQGANPLVTSAAIGSIHEDLPTSSLGAEETGSLETLAPPVVLTGKTKHATRKTEYQNYAPLTPEMSNIICTKNFIPMTYGTQCLDYAVHKKSRHYHLHVPKAKQSTEQVKQEMLEMGFQCLDNFKQEVGKEYYVVALFHTVIPENSRQNGPGDTHFVGIYANNGKLHWAEQSSSSNPAPQLLSTVFTESKQMNKPNSTTGAKYRGIYLLSKND